MKQEFTAQQVLNALKTTDLPQLTFYILGEDGEFLKNKSTGNLMHIECYQDSWGLRTYGVYGDIFKKGHVDNSEVNDEELLKQIELVMSLGKVVTTAEYDRIRFKQMNYTTKTVTDNYRRRVEVVNETKQIYNYNNKERKVTCCYNMYDSDFWTEVTEDGVVTDVEERLQTWNNVVKFWYGLKVAGNSTENDPKKKLWEQVVEYVKANQTEFFDENGDWLEDMDASVIVLNNAELFTK